MWHVTFLWKRCENISGTYWYLVDMHLRTFSGGILLHPTDEGQEGGEGGLLDIYELYMGAKSIPGNRRGILSGGEGFG